MRHLNTIRTILNSLDVGEPVVEIRLRNKTSIQTIEKSWTPDLVGDSFHETLIKQNTRRTTTSGPSRRYVVDVTGSISNIRSVVFGNVMGIFSESCPNKSPRRTKLHKDLSLLIRSLHRSEDDSDVVNLVFDIVQYYDSVTKEYTLKDTKNSVHRSNIYQLLNILEQKHGSNKEISNG